MLGLGRESDDDGTPAAAAGAARGSSAPAPGGPSPPTPVPSRPADANPGQHCDPLPAGPPGSSADGGPLPANAKAKANGCIHSAGPSSPHAPSRAGGPPVPCPAKAKADGYVLPAAPPAGAHGAKANAVPTPTVKAARAAPIGHPAPMPSPPRPGPAHEAHAPPAGLDPAREAHGVNAALPGPTAPAAPIGHPAHIGVGLGNGSGSPMNVHAANGQMTMPLAYVNVPHVLQQQPNTGGFRVNVSIEVVIRPLPPPREPDAEA